MKYISLSLLALLCLTSCGEDAFQRRRVINVSYTPKLVVYGLLYANEGALVKVNRTFAAAGEGSAPYYGNPENDPTIVKNATVVIKNDQNQRFVLTYDTDLEAYYNPLFIPQPGKTYQLEASLATFTTVTASATVLTTSASVKNTQQQADGYFKFTLQDAAATKDYYALYCDDAYARELGYSNGCGLYTKDSFLKQYALGSEQIIVSTGGEATSFYEGAFFADDNISGKETILSVFVSTRDDLYIAKISNEVYKYQAAYFDQVSNQGNPLGEPADIPTNVTGGLGYFGAITPLLIKEGTNDPRLKVKRMKTFARFLP